MTVRRREFITGATTVGGTVLAGCAGLNEPEMEFQNFVVPDPNVVSVNEEDREYALLTEIVDTVFHSKSQPLTGHQNY